METIHYELNWKGLVSTLCPFDDMPDYGKRVGCFDCEHCPAFVSHDIETRTVVCNPEKVPTARFVWSDKMLKKYPNLGKDKVKAA